MSGKTEVATFAGGCFWGVEELLRAIPGVVDISVGYTGGATESPKYEEVKTGKTGHAEAVQVIFDPSMLSFEELMMLFFKLHDPTTPNRQGNDIGSQYRSAVFTHSDEQHRIAQSTIEKINVLKKWPKPIITEIVPFTAFFLAEEYHQDYLQKNPNGYTCHFFRKW